ncbi:MAG: hypothetical protein WC071_13380 [Victivallaceae bacterium]
MSKKMMLAGLVAVGCFAFNASAQTAAVPAEKAKVQVEATKATVPVEAVKTENSSPIQVGFWFDVPGYTEKYKVHGFRLGFPFSGTSMVSGFDLSLFGSHINNLDGAQVSIGYCGTSAKSYGLQAAVGVCMNTGHFDGVQLSLFNKADVSKGWQVGGGNVTDDIDGAQVGLANVVDKVKGFQAGIVNVVTRSIGPQIGLVNYADRSSFQLGLVNINKKSGMPFMILFNYSK